MLKTWFKNKILVLSLALWGGGGFLPSHLNAADSFRVTEYLITSPTFSGTTHQLTLNQDLEEEHIILVRGGADLNTNRGPNDNYVRVFQLPAGMNGELAASPGADRIGLARSGSDGNWEGVITVIESLADHTRSGFKLLDVVDMTATNTAATGTDASGTNWSDMAQVVLFGGPFGAGAEPTSTANAEHNSAWIRLYPSGNNVINWARDGTARALETSEYTVYVVEFGSEWTIQKATVTAGTAGANGANAISHYDTATLSTSVERNDTWVWGTGMSADNGHGDGAEGILVTLGDGVDDTSGSKNTIAVGSEYADPRTFDVYVMTHDDLMVDYRFKSDGDSGALTRDVTVDNNTGANRMAWVSNGVAGTGNRFPRPIFSARYLNNTTVRLQRSYTGSNFPAWVQAINFSSVTHVVPVERYWISTTAGDWNDSSNWSWFSNGDPGADPPVAGEQAIFDGAGGANGNVTIDTNVVVGTMSLTGYTGTIDTKGFTITVSSAFIQSSGKISFGTSQVTMEGDFTHSGGTFSANTSTFTFSGSEDQSLTSGSTSFYHLVLNKTAGTVTLSDTLDINGNLTITQGTLDTGSDREIQLEGSLLQTGGTLTMNQSSITFNGAGNDTLSASSALSHVVMNKSAGTLTLGQNLDINGNLTLTAGELSTSNSNYTISLAGDWTRTSGTFTTNASTITIDGTGTSTLTGSTTFYGLASITSGKTIEFVAGTSYYATGHVDFENVTLRSTSNNATWYFTYTGSSQTLLSIDVRDSNALGGSTLVMDTASTDSGNNLNWALGDLNRYWIGETAGNWNDTSNWSLASGGTSGAAVPASNNAVIFDGRRSLNGNVTVNTAVTIATLTVDGYTGTLDTIGTPITISNTFTQDSGSILFGTSAVTLQGNLTRTGGSFTIGQSTFTFSGNQNQTLTQNNTSFYHVEINKTGGTLTLAENLDINGIFTLTAGTLNTANYAMDVAEHWFRNGGTFSVGGTTVTLSGGGVIHLTGSTTFHSLVALTNGATLQFQAGATTYINHRTNIQDLSLKSSTAGSTWYLTHTGSNQTFNNVIVQDSDASGGITLVTDTNSFDAGNNINWNFGAPDAIDDLTATTGTDALTISLTWSATGDDGSVGTLNNATFTIQYTTIATFTDWNPHVDLTTAPVIHISTTNVQPNSSHGTTLMNLFSNTTHYIRIWTQDDESNTSPLSNGATAMTLPKVIQQGNTFVNVFESSVTVAWVARPVSPSSMSASGYTVQASTESDFTGLLLSSQTTNVNLSTLTVTGLVSNTTYYFRIGSFNSKFQHHYTSVGSTKTLESIDTIPPDTINTLSASTLTATSMILRWTAPFDPTDNPLNGNYAIQYSTWTGVTWSTTNAQVTFSTSSVSSGDPQHRIVTGLDPNTSYYFRIWTSDLKPNWSSESNRPDEMTLAVLLSNITDTSVLTTAISLGWTALPSTPQKDSAKGYTLQASTASDFTGTLFSSTTLSLPASTLTVSGLQANTTYYLRAGSINLKDATNYAATLTTSSLANAPTTLATTFIDVSLSSITANWAALPTTPPDETSEGYRLQASSTNFDGTGTVYSSVTTHVLVSTLTVVSLDANTTYYFRVGSLNWSSVPNYTTLSATSSLTNPPTGISFTNIQANNATLTWSAPAGGAEGYRVEASSTQFNGTGTLSSSATTNGSLTTLTVSSLLANTTYYFRVGSLNWNQAVRYAASVATASLANAPTSLSSDFVATHQSSITVHWAALPGTPEDQTSEGYRVEASSTNFNGTGTTYSSVTTNVALSTLTVVSLDVNTTYYFRVGSLNWNENPNYTTLSATSTLANIPTSAASTFTAVNISSVTATWQANGNPTNTEYELQFSTASDFTGPIESSTSTTTSGTVMTLSPNTTYFVQVRANNHNGTGTDFLALGSTVTLSAAPGMAATVFTPVHITSLTVNFTAGSPANPNGTQYTVEIATESAFTTTTTSSTLNLNATYTGLSINTTYYARALSQNHSGLLSAYTSFGSSVTEAVEPGPIASTFTNVTNKAVSFQWSSGTAAGGYNPSTTTYHAQISDVSNFATIVAEANVTTLSHTFSNLASDTIFYVRVRAKNHADKATAYVNYGSTQTVASSLPVFITGTFQVTDSQGSFIDGSLYTDTTTVSARVNVRSSNPPGLAVTDTPAMAAIWHMDSAEGVDVQDASRHGQTLSLQGTPVPSTTTGLMGNALDFDGSQNYAVSPDMQSTNLRDSAANNTWTVEFWFRTNTGAGQAFCQANINAGTGGTTDNQFGWNTSGNFRWRVRNSGGGAAAWALSQGWTDGEWHYAAGVIGPSGRYFYVDGVLQQSDPAYTNNSVLTYGGAIYNWVGSGTRTNGFDGTRYPGDIDEVRVSTVEFTAAQITENYHHGKLFGHRLGSPEVDISTRQGTNFTWVRQSSTNITITGTNGTTAEQTFTISNVSVNQSTQPAEPSNQIKFFATDLDAGLTTAQYTILVDTTAPVNNGMSALTSISTQAITATALAGSDALSGLHSTPYLIQTSSQSDFSVIHSSSNYMAGLSYGFTSLDPNTTYYFRLGVRDTAGNDSAFSSSISTSTLANPVQSISVQAVYSTSATLTWDALPTTPSSSTAEGYSLQASSTNFNGTGDILSISTDNVAGNTLTVEGLSVNTTYYFRVGSLNWNTVANYTSGPSTSTLTNVPASPSIDAVHVTSMTVSWSVPVGEAEGYRLETSTNADFSNNVFSSATTNGTLTTLTVVSLDPNTTYYVRVGAVNWNSVANYVSVGATSTLTNLVQSPSFTNIFITSVTASWSEPTGGAAGYRLESSTNSDFSNNILSSVTSNGSLTTLTVESLDANTTYYFRIGAVNWNSVVQYLTFQATSTLTNVVDNESLSSVDITSVTATWDAPTGGSVGYHFQASTNADFSNNIVSSVTTNQDLTTLTVSALSPNTTYYFRVGSVNWNDQVQFKSLGSTATFVNPVTAQAFNSVDITSITVTWTLPIGGAAEYQVEASTASDFTGTLVSSVSTTGGETSLAVESLDPNTTYYMRVAAVNWNQRKSYVTVGSTSTRTNPATSLTFTSIQTTSVTVQWTLPIGGATRFRLDASTNSNFSNNVVSSETTNPSLTSLTALSLTPNTTYFFRVAAFNWNNIINYSASLTTSTLAESVNNTAFTNVYITSATLSWDEPTDSTAGYRVEASTASDFTGTLESSQTTNGSLTTLTVPSLDSNTTYYFRVGSLNWNNQIVYAGALSTSTLANAPGSVSISVVYNSSIPVTWALPAGGADGFRVEASTASDFTGTILSSETTSDSSTGLTVINLDAHTTYYFRVGAINHNSQPTYSGSISTSTLANQITRIQPDVVVVYSSSITVRWAALPSTPQSSTSEGYRLEASSTNFDGSGTIYSSVTTNVALSTLTVTSLDPNLTYYFRLGTLNWNDVLNFVTLQATSTLAGQPGSPSFTNVFVSSVSLTWSVPAGNAEGYVVNASTMSDFTGSVLSSATDNGANTSLTVLSLFSDTTYYFRVGSLNWNSEVNYVDAGSTQTLPSIDLVAPAAVTDLNATTLDHDSIQLTWTAPLDTTDNPLSGTYFIHYETHTSVTWSTTSAQISIATSNVTPGADQSRVENSLDPNTTYYFRIFTQDIRPNTSPISNGTTVATLANVPQDVSITSVFETSTTLDWTAFPVTPSSSAAEGFVLEASTASDFTGTLLSSSTSVGTLSSLTVINLDRFTTYYFRLGSLNWVNATHYATSLTTSTLSQKPAQLSTDFTTTTTETITARWVALPTLPQSSSADGYRLEASSTNFDGTGTVYSSATPNVSVSTLVISGLSVNLTYYFRVASLNWNDVPNFTSLSSTSTLANPPTAAAPPFSPVHITSVTLNWLANDNSNSTQYDLELATASDFTGTLQTTTTLNLNHTFTSLNPNATYYAQVRSINNNNIRTSYTSLNSTMTHASAPGAGSPVFTPVHITSFTVNYTAGSPANPSGTQYRVDISTASDFTGTLTSSQTLNLTATFTSVMINTTYYAQARAMNSLNVDSTVTNLTSTVTLSVLPGSAASTFTAIGNRDFTLNWTSGTVSSGFNPTGTTYQAQISTASDFTGTITSIETTNLSTTFGGLDPGTTYYNRLRSINHTGLRTDFKDYGDVTTTPTSEPEFTLSSFQITDSLGSYIDSSLYTDTTTISARISVESRFAPGLAVTDTPSDLALWHLDDGSGSTGVDSSLHSNDLTLSGAPLPSWVTGLVGEALDFDGSQNYGVSSTNLTQWRKDANNNTWTVELWFKTGSNVGYLFQVANTNTSPSSAFDLDIGWHNTSGNLAFALRTTGGQQKIAESSSNYADDNWHHVAALLNSSGMYLYVDGSEVASNTEINGNTAKRYSSSIYAWVGAANLLDSNIGNGSRFSTANIDDVRISTLPLTADQINRNYQLGARGIMHGGPSIDVSTQAGNNFTWVRLSTNNVSITGSNGTTALQTFTGSSFNVTQTTAAGESTNQIMFLATDLDGNRTTAQFTILVDTTAPTNVGINTLTNVTTGHINATVLTAADSPSGLNTTPYNIEVSTSASYVTILSSTNFISSPSSVFTDLDPNTTYYFRSQARDTAGNVSAYSATTATSTLANLVPGLSVTQINPSSVTVSWTGLPLSPSSSSAQGYYVQASTDSNFNGTLHSSSTANVSLTTLTVPGLDDNTTYYFRVGSLNHQSGINFNSAVSTMTLSLPVSAAQIFAVYTTSITVNWDDPTSQQATGYRLETSSSAAFEEPIFSSATTNVALSTLTISNLEGGNTYYFRMVSLNHVNDPSYTTTISTYLPLVLGIDLSLDTIGIPGLTDMGDVVIITTSVVATNTGNGLATFEFSATTTTVGSPWAIGTTQAQDQYVLWAVINSTQPSTANFSTEDKLSESNVRCTSTAITMGNESCVSVPAGESRTIWFQLGMPTSTSTGAAQQIRITGEATQPD